MRKIPVLFFKSRVKAHTRTVNGKVITVREYEDKRTKAALEPSSNARHKQPAKQGLPESIDVDGVMRPTLNSEGRPIHPTEEGIRNFWRWFSGSKVVDGQGRPLVVYHGTPALNKVVEHGFNENKITNTDFKGFYFSPHIDYVNKFADATKKNDEITQSGEDFENTAYGVLAAYINISNPLDLTKPPRDHLEDLIKISEAIGAKDEMQSIIRFYDKKNKWESYTVDNVIEELIDYSARKRRKDLFDAIVARNYKYIEKYGDDLGHEYIANKEPSSSKLLDERRLLKHEYFKVSKAIKKLGYDSIIRPDAISMAIDGLLLPKKRISGIADAYIVFSPTQIKSAIGNTGAFSPDDPVITKSLPRITSIRLTRI